MGAREAVDMMGHDPTPQLDELASSGIRVDAPSQELPVNLNWALAEPNRSAARRALRRSFLALARRPLARRLIQVALLRDPQNLAWFLCGVSDQLALATSFGTAVEPSGELRAFEDCAWLFSSNALNHGLSRLDLQEAAYLYGLVRSLDDPRVAEIGRFKGGTTMLLAAAGACVVSIDNDREQLRYGPALARALEAHGLRERVDIVIGDSRTHPAEGVFDLVVLDGDHAYEGVKADFDHWWPAIASGGHLLCHDACIPPGTITPAPEAETVGVAQLVAELERSGMRRVDEGRAGSFAHFVKQS